MQKQIYFILFLFMVSCSPDQKKVVESKEDVRIAAPTIEKDVTTEKVDIKERVDLVVENTTSGEEEIVKSEPKVNPTPKPKSTPKPTTSKTSSIYVGNPVHEFGRVTEGDTVIHTFVFENRGNGDLIIKDVLVDCGCTVPEYSKQPITPGSSETIEVTFNTKGKIGGQERFITILTNGEPRSKIVKLKGIVDTE